MQAEAFEDCLDDWSLQWTDLDAEDRDSYRDQCKEEEQIWLNSLSKEQRETESQLCSALIEDIDSSSDCTQIRQALIDYGQ